MEAEVTIDPLPEHHTPFDIFSAVTDIENLIKLIVVESNLYAQQKGREFQINEQEMRASLGINYVMSINKLPTIKSYWECGQFVGNESIRNVMSRSRFEEICYNTCNVSLEVNFIFYTLSFNFIFYTLSFNFIFYVFKGKVLYFPFCDGFF